MTRNDLPPDQTQLQNRAYYLYPSNMDHLALNFYSSKEVFSHYVPIDRDILHVVIGVMLALIAFVVAKGMTRTKPYVLTLAFACVLGAGMEVLDMRHDILTLGAWQWWESALDFGRTIIGPLAMLLAVCILRPNTRHSNQQVR
ncbi:hypothetical protein [Palleronia caenipelagi]|uniref:Uncharacterized protein n=1 Tax=Palleronia caenipelagi TaxID=2489174 RepID=A0A547PXP1_9RHOB|nr:hypothetical protein [Palleronia caenipelagi]TRD18869.1 hypothetical protein FEV53_11585 [Palleronia caenipelagi]